MNKYYVKSSMIDVAAGLARGDALTRLYTLAENQKTVSTSVLLDELDFAGEFLKIAALKMRQGADLIKE
jgi:hypothetical protein